MNSIINCKICGEELTGKQTIFCSSACKNKSHQSYNAQQERGQRRKKKIIEELGGKCENCGYCKNSSALTFHHTDPKKKEFKLDLRSLSNRKYSVIEKEIKKCRLLCHNCHAELHNPQHNLA